MSAEWKAMADAGTSSVNQPPGPRLPTRRSSRALYFQRSLFELLPGEGGFLVPCSNPCLAEVPALARRLNWGRVRNGSERRLRLTEDNPAGRDHRGRHRCVLRHPRSADHAGTAVWTGVFTGTWHGSPCDISAGHAVLPAIFSCLGRRLPGHAPSGLRAGPGDRGSPIRATAYGAPGRRISHSASTTPAPRVSAGVVRCERVQE
jgi:hypothetical protein